MEAKTVRMGEDARGMDAARRNAAPSGMRRMARSPWARAFVAATLLGGAACAGDEANIKTNVCDGKGCREINGSTYDFSVGKGGRVTVALEAQEDSKCTVEEFGGQASLSCAKVEKAEKPSTATTVTVAVISSVLGMGVLAIFVKYSRDNKSGKGGTGGKIPGM